MLLGQPKTDGALYRFSPAPQEMWVWHLGLQQSRVDKKTNCIFPNRCNYKEPLGHSNLITCLTSVFGEKKSCQTPKKKEKKSSLVSYRQKWFWNFLSDSKKKKKKVQVLRIFFVSVIQSTKGSYHCCSRASDLTRYTSHPSGYRD